MPDGWAASQIADALIRLWVKAGWWGVCVIGFWCGVYKWGWPWTPFLKWMVSRLEQHKA